MRRISKALLLTVCSILSSQMLSANCPADYYHGGGYGYQDQMMMNQYGYQAHPAYGYQDNFNYQAHPAYGYQDSYSYQTRPVYGYHTYQEGFQNRPVYGYGYNQGTFGTQDWQTRQAYGAQGNFQNRPIYGVQQDNLQNRSLYGVQQDNLQNRNLYRSDIENRGIDNVNTGYGFSNERTDLNQVPANANFRNDTLNTQGINTSGSVNQGTVPSDLNQNTSIRR